MNEVFKSISHFSEAELNAIYTYKKTIDDLRGFKKPYSSVIIGYQNDVRSIENFVDLVTKNFHISHRFYRLHAKLLKQKRLKFADRGSKIGIIKKNFDFESTVEINRRAFAKVGKKYIDWLDSYLKNGQIDVFPKKGKTSGAFCWTIPELSTFVLLNHTSNLRSVETLGHEMGHAFHGELTKAQPIQYRGHSTATAEVASTFFEQIASNEIAETLSNKEKIIFLHNKILGSISTIFRQIACFNFQTELFNMIRLQGQVSKEQLAKLMKKHMESYLGSAVEVTEDDGYDFVYWSHLRWFFYVYSYAYGELISKVLIHQYLYL